MKVQIDPKTYGLQRYYLRPPSYFLIIELTIKPQFQLIVSLGLFIVIYCDAHFYAILEFIAYLQLYLFITKFHITVIIHICYFNIAHQ